MKNKIIILLVVFVLGFLLQSDAQKSSGFKITGSLKGLPDGTTVYLTTQERDTIAKVVSKEDQFFFEGNLLQNGRFHFIKIDTLISKVGTNAIFVVNGKMSVSGTLGQSDVIVVGSSAHSDYVNLLNVLSPFQKERAAINLALKQCYLDIKAANEQKDTTKIGILIAKEKELYKNRGQVAIIRSNARLKWLKEHKESLYTPYVIKGSIDSAGLEGMQKSYEELSLDAKLSYYGQELKKYLDNKTIASKIRKDNIIPNFSITSSNGEKVKILDLARKNKFTLIDVWASWCSPCRSAIPELKKLYDSHKNKGFGLIGISTDKSMSAWKKAIVEDGSTWFQGIDEQNICSQLFAIKAIPAYILIDSSGKLIAFDSAMSSVSSFGGSLHGEHLKNKIEVLIKENK